MSGDCHIRVQASIAEAVVRWNCLPDKMNPVVRPLMDSLRREDDTKLQVSASLLSLLLWVTEIYWNTSDNKGKSKSIYIFKSLMITGKSVYRNFWSE